MLAPHLFWLGVHPMLRVKSHTGGCLYVSLRLGLLEYVLVCPFLGTGHWGLLVG